MNTQQSESHDWDGTPSVAKWSDIWTVEELAAVLDVHAAKLAKAGMHGMATDLSLASQALLDLGAK